MDKNNFDISKLNTEQINSVMDRLTPKEKELAISILQQYANEGHSNLLDDLILSDYDEAPVDIHTFLHDKRYLGNALYDKGKFTVFPYWEKTLENIFPDNVSTRYNTVIFTGAIGLGKSTIAVIILLYLLHRLLCLKDPYNYYGLQPIDKISISFMNITLENAKGVAMDKMNQMILSSEWFLDHGEMAGTVNLEYRPNKHIELIAASSNNQVIGRALFGNFTDEVNFGLTSNVEKLKKKQKMLISQIDARMKSRFMRTKKDGSTYLPTINIIASSKNSDQSFLDDYIETKKKNESVTTLIVDEAQWVVDSRKDNPIKFWVALGNKFLANELLPLDANEMLVDEYKAKGYKMLAVPIGYWENFQDNLDGALTDIAGISTQSSTKFISGMRWNEVKTDSYENPFTKDVITVGNNPLDTAQYQDFFDMSKVNMNYLRKPLYIHLDMSLTGDKTGIAGVWITRKNATENESDSSEMFFKLAFSVSIAAPKGFQVSFEKNRKFIRWLKDQGFKIAGITSDTFQSAQIQQQLKADGFEVAILSVDRLQTLDKVPNSDNNEIEEASGRTSVKRVCLPYQYLKSTIYEHRIEVYKKCNQLTEEILALEKKSDGHIDHPPKGCFTADTKVKLTDGRSLNFLELINEYENGKQNYVYSVNLDKKIIEPKRILKAWKTLENQKLIKITLDNGESVKCTLNHKFMLRNGTYVEAKDLMVGDSLMPLYLKYSDSGLKGYRLYYEPFEDKWHYEHRRFAKNILDEKYLVHHIDYNKKNNNPDNLIWCSKQEHKRIHDITQTGAQSKESKIKRQNSVRNWHEKNKDSEMYQIRTDKIRESLKQYYILKNGYNTSDEIKKHISDIEKYFNIKWDDISINERVSYGVRFSLINDPSIKDRISKSLSEKHLNGCFDNAKKALADYNNNIKILKQIYPEIDLDKFYELFGIRYESLTASQKGVWSNRYRRKLYELKNHTVKSIEYLDYVEDVYDIEVEDNHNFALDCGVFVHNSKDQIDAVCGAVYNASLHAEEYAFLYGESVAAKMALDVNDSDEIETDRNQLTVDFEKELQKMSGMFKQIQKLQNDESAKFSDSDTKNNYYLLNDNIII